MSQVQVLRRGYFWCTITCLCRPCRWSDAWFEHLKFAQIRLFRGDPE